MRRLTLAMLFLVTFGARLAAGQACSLTITTLNFGTYNATLLDGTAAGTVTCTGAWDIPLNAGTGAGGTETLRKMTGPGGVELSYELFTNAGRTTNWGDTQTTDLNGNGNTNITVYGQIPAGQNVAQGTYIDTVSSATTSFTVVAEIKPQCTISANTLAFGAYTGVLLHSTSTISVTCTNYAAYNVGLNAGLATGATVTTRKMTGTYHGGTLSYSLYSNATHTTNWGQTVGTDTVAGIGTGVIQSLTVYGQIPAGTIPAADGYSDTITATVTY